MIKQIVAFLISFCLIFEQTGFAKLAIPMGIPGYLSSLAPVADKFRPIHLRSIDLNPGNGNFELILDKGDLNDIQPRQLEETTQQLYRYFQVGLVLPNKYFWVNLRPDSPDEVIEPLLEKTDVGRIMLASDLQLKKDLANFTSPQTPEGKLYWDRLYAKAGELYNQQDIQIPTLTRPWIVPGEIVIRSSPTGAFVYKATLKVMLEQDYIKDSPAYNFSDPRLKELNSYSSKLIRELIIPKLTREVNSSKRYAQLRQVYYSLILAQWFKSKSFGMAMIEGRVAMAQKTDSQDLSGLTSKTSWSKDTYYRDYRKSFQKGEYNRQEQVSSVSGLSIRQYFSGGIMMMDKPVGEWTVISKDGGFAANQPFFERLAIDSRGDVANLPASSTLADGGQKTNVPSVETVKAASGSNPKKAVRLRDIPQKIIDYEAYLAPPLGVGAAVFVYSISPVLLLWLIPVGIAAVAIIGAELASLEYRNIKKTDPDLLLIVRGNPLSLINAVESLALGLDGIFDMGEVWRSPSKVFVNLTRIMYSLPTGLIWTAMELAIDYFNGSRTGENILKSKLDMMRFAIRHSSGINPLKVMYKLFPRWCFAKGDVERRFMLYETTLLHVRSSGDLEAAKEDTFRNNTFFASEAAFYHLLKQLKLEEFDETLEKIKQGDNILYRGSQIKKKNISSDDLINLYLAERNSIWQVRQDRGLTEQDQALIDFFAKRGLSATPDYRNMPYYAFVVLKLLDRHFKDYFSANELLGTPKCNELLEMDHLTNEEVIKDLIEARIVIENGDEYFLSENFKQIFLRFLDKNYSEITEAELSGVPEHEGALHVDGKLYRWAQNAASSQRGKEALDGGTKSIMQAQGQNKIKVINYPRSGVIAEPNVIGLKNIVTGKDFELRRISSKKNSFSVWMDNVKLKSLFEFDEDEKEVAVHNMAVPSEYTSQGIGLTVLRYLAQRARTGGKDLVLHTVFSYAVARMCYEHISKNARYRENWVKNKKFDEIDWFEEFGPLRIRIADQYFLKYQKAPGSQELVYLPSERTDLQVRHIEDEFAKMISVRLLDDGRVLADWKSAAGKSPLTYQVFLSKGVLDISIRNEDIMTTGEESDGGKELEVAEAGLNRDDMEKWVSDALERPELAAGIKSDVGDVLEMSEQELGGWYDYFRARALKQLRESKSVRMLENKKGFKLWFRLNDFDLGGLLYLLDEFKDHSLSPEVSSARTKPGILESRWLRYTMLFLFGATLFSSLVPLVSGLDAQLLENHSGTNNTFDQPVTVSTEVLFDEILSQDRSQLVVVNPYLEQYVNKLLDWDSKDLKNKASKLTVISTRDLRTSGEFNNLLQSEKKQGNADRVIFVGKYDKYQITQYLSQDQKLAVGDSGRINKLISLRDQLNNLTAGMDPNAFYEYVSYRNKLNRWPTEKAISIQGGTPQEQIDRTERDLAQTQAWVDQNKEQFQETYDRFLEYDNLLYDETSEGNVPAYLEENNLTVQSLFPDIFNQAQRGKHASHVEKFILDHQINGQIPGNMVSEIVEPLPDLFLSGHNKTYGQDQNRPLLLVVEGDAIQSLSQYLSDYQFYGAREGRVIEVFNPTGRDLGESVSYVEYKGELGYQIGFLGNNSGMAKNNYRPDDLKTLEELEKLKEKVNGLAQNYDGDPAADYDKYRRLSDESYEISLHMLAIETSEDAYERRQEWEDYNRQHDELQPELDKISGKLGQPLLWATYKFKEKLYEEERTGAIYRLIQAGNDPQSWFPVTFSKDSSFQYGSSLFPDAIYSLKTYEKVGGAYHEHDADKIKDIEKAKALKILLEASLSDYKKNHPNSTFEKDCEELKSRITKSDTDVYMEILFSGDPRAKDICRILDIEGALGQSGFYGVYQGEDGKIYSSEESYHAYRDYTAFRDYVEAKWGSEPGVARSLIWLYLIDPAMVKDVTSGYVSIEVVDQLPLPNPWAEGMTLPGVWAKGSNIFLLKRYFPLSPEGDQVGISAHEFGHVANELKAYDEDGQLGVIRWALGYLLTPSDEEIAVTKEQIVVENVYWQVKKPYFSDRITVLDPVELDSLQNAIKDARENQTLEKSNEEIFPNETRKTYDFVTKGALASLIGGIGVLFAGVRTLRSRRVRFAGDRLKDDDLAEQINGFKHSLISPPSANSVLTEDDSELNDGGFSRVRELDRLAEERSLDIKIFGEGLSRVIGTARKADPAGTLLVVIAGTISSGKTGVKDYSTSLLTGAGETVVFLDSERFLIPADKRNKSLSYPRLKFDVDEHNKVLAALKKGEHAFVKFTDRNIRQHITLTPAERQRCRYLSGERTIYGQHALNRIMDEEIMRHVLKYQAKIQSRLWFDEENGEIFEEIVPEKETFLVISDIALIEPYSDKRFDYSCFVWMPRQERKNNFIESWARGEQYAGIFKNKSEVAAYFDLLAKEDEILLQGVPYADAVVRPDPVTTTASILGTGQDGGFAEGDGRQSINTVFAVHLDEYPATDKIKQMNKMAYRAAFEDGLFKEYIAGQIADFIQRNYNNKISCPLKINNIDIIYENRGGFKDIFRVSVVVSPEVNATETQKKQLADQGFTGKVDFCLPALRPYYEAFKGERSSSVETFGKDFREEFDRLKDFQKLGEETERRLMVEPYSLKVQQTGNVLYYLREWVDGDTAAQLFAAKKIGVDKIEDIVSAWMTVVKVLRKYVRNPGLNNVMMRTDGSFVIADPGLVSSINERLVIFSLDNHCRLAGVPNEQAMRKAIFSGVIKALGEVEGRDFLISALEQGKEDKFALDLKLFLEESAISTPDGGVKDFVGSIEMRGGGVKVLGVVDNSRSPKTIAVVHTGSLVPARENDSKEHRILLVQPSEVTGYTPRQCIEIVRKLAQTKNKDVIDNLGINLKDNLERILTKNFLVVENTLVVMSPEGVILTGRVDSWFRGEIRNLVMKERVGKKVFNRKDVGDGLDNLKNEILAEYKAQKKKPASKEGVAAPQDGGAEDLVITKVYGKDFEVRKDISTGIKLCDGRNYKSNNPAIDARVLFELYKQIHPDIVFDNPANKKYDLRRFERLLKGNDPKEFLWVYEPVPGQIKGYLTAEFFLYDYFNIANNKTVFIGQVAVATDTQKQGVATALWLAAMQFMERRKVTTYKVTALSPYSASIAERLGWKKTADNGKAARYSYNAFDGGDAGRLDGGATAPGGVDFRELPVSGQPSIAPVLMPQLQKLAQNSRMKDLDREWNNIRGEMLAPEMPYNRIKEYIAVCLNRPGCRKKLDQAVTCIIDILRMEEDQALATNQELKDILMYLS